MSLKALIEVAVTLLEAIDDLAGLFEELKEEKRAGGNPPPEVSVHDEMMRRWPTRREMRLRPAWPPFEGHRYGLGGGDAE